MLYSLWLQRSIPQRILLRLILSGEVKDIGRSLVDTPVNFEVLRRVLTFDLGLAVLVLGRRLDGHLPCVHGSTVLGSSLLTH